MSVKQIKRVLSFLMILVLVTAFSTVSFAAEIAPRAVTQTMVLGQLYRGSTASEIAPARDSYDEYYLRLTAPATITFVVTHNDPNDPGPFGEGGFYFTLDYGADSCALQEYRTEYTVSLGAGLHNISIMSNRFATGSASYTMFAYSN